MTVRSEQEVESMLKLAQRSLAYLEAQAQAGTLQEVDQANLVRMRERVQILEWILQRDQLHLEYHEQP